VVGGPKNRAVAVRTDNLAQEILMGSWADSVAYWLIDYYLAATLLLLLLVGVVRVISQPARRVAVVWGGLLGLILLAGLCATPGWHRYAILPRFEAPDAATKDADARTSSISAEPASGRQPELTAAEALNSATTASKLPSIPKQNKAVLSTESVAVLRSKPVPASTAIDHTKSVATTAVAPPEVTSSKEGTARGFWTATVDRLSAIDQRPVRFWGLWIFLAGFALTAFRIVHGVIAANRLCRQASQALADVVAELARIVEKGERCPQLLISSQHPVPIATGTLRPTILLPVPFASEERSRDCRSVLAHEWAHIRNGDLWLLAVDRWLLPLLWMHPLYLRLRKSIRNDQELLADAAAATQSSPVDYAEMLLHWARKMAAERMRLHGSTALGVWEQPSLLSDRIAKLLHKGPRVELRCTRRWRLSCLLTLASLTVLLSTATVRPAALPVMPATAQSTVPRPETAVASISASQLESAITRAVTPQAASDADPAELQRQWELEQPAITEIRRLGGHVKTEPFGPVRLVTEVNMVYGFDENGVRVENTNFNDECLPYIAKFRNLKVLALAGQQVTDLGMHQLPALSRLERLCLWDAKLLTRYGAAELAGLQQLKHLEMSNAPIGDVAIEHLSHINTLEELSVQGGTLSDRAIEYAARLPNLKSLMLDFGDKPVAPEAVTPLAHAPALKQLSLQSSALSDQVLIALKAIGHLRYLFLGEGRTTDEGLKALRESLPNLHVITPERTYPALATHQTVAECEGSIRHSQEAVALVRKFLKRVTAGNDEAAAELIASKADIERHIGAVRGLRAIEKVEWNLAYTDSNAALAVSTEFTDPFGVEQVIACTTRCVDGEWKIDDVAVTASREGVERQIRQFAAAHPRANAGKGWLPL